jgi:hypothetical protein
MKRQYYNINSNVWVKLTPWGHELYKKFWSEALNGSSIENAYPILHTDEKGWTEFQMWDLMCIFGSYLYNGCKNPFETNIKFRKEDFTSKEPTPQPQ